MRWLNYHHLLYFWLVAREGGLVRASAELRLAPSTLSSQVRALEAALGEKLFARRGRKLVLTEMGQVAFRYADEIFAMGKELQDAMARAHEVRPLTLSVGVADAMPKLVAQKLIEAALQLPQPVHLVCSEGNAERLVSQLALHELDIVLCDVPARPSLRVRAHSHLLGECGTSFFAARALARTYSKRFPASLSGAPLLLPAEGTHLRRSLDHWFAGRGLSPRVVGEFADSALLKAFGQAGAGIFPAPSVISREVERQYQVRCIGSCPEISERYYAISVERRLRHPAVVAIREQARHQLFA